LRCEYRIDPIGIGSIRPRLSWRLGDERAGAVQRASQVLVASDASLLVADRGDLWDPGRVVSTANAQVAYAGAALASRRRAWWKVRTFDGDGTSSPWSAPASFEMGLLERDDWTAAWIAAPLVGSSATSAPVPALRREFRIERPVAHARLYVTALGLYEVSIGGRRVGDHQLAPGWTDYRKRVRYQAYDVTEHLVEGANEIDALLADGWYCGFIGLRGAREGYGRRPALLAQLEIVHDDGTTLRVCSDAEWRWQTSAILAADLMQGESVDLRHGLAPSAWSSVDLLDPPDLALDAMAGPPVRVVRELAPVSGPVPIPGGAFGVRWIFDLGQNMVGRVRLRMRGKAGTSVRLRHAEMLNPDGSLYTANLKGAAATDTFSLAGTGEAETLEPRFTFHGFRYVEVSGSFPRDAIEELTGVVLCSDMARTGEFACSDADLNQLQSNIEWGQRGNFLDVPTDCPQRDERLGWTGDAQVFVRTAAFNMDVAGFFAKWLRDLEDAQAPDGRIPCVAPAPPGAIFVNDVDGGPAWGDAVVVCPWTIWRCYGDERILEERWGSMTRYVDYLLERFPDGIRADPERDPWGGFGDWCALDGSVRRENRIGATPKDLIGTAFLARSSRLLAEVARVLRKPEEEKRYAELAARVRDAFRRRFVTPDGLVAGNTQTSYVLALHFDLLAPREREVSGAALARNVELHGHLTTGFVGTPYLLQALTATGRLDLAYRLLLRREYPGWLFPVVEGGATTIWERWNGWTKEDGFFDPEMNSFNHYAYGAVGAFLYGAVAGLDLDEGPEASGWRRGRIAPRPPVHSGLPQDPLLTHARAALATQHGRWSVEWRIEGERFRLELHVPTGCTARVDLPDGTSGEVGAGTHREDRPMADLRG
jgi:alpha-L-rhamnosidase